MTSPCLASRSLMTLLLHRDTDLLVGFVGMAEIKKIWVVTDPTDVSEMIDILYEPPNMQKFADWVTGTNTSRRWAQEHVKLYSDESSARRDAEARMAKRDARLKKQASPERVVQRYQNG